MGTISPFSAGIQKMYFGNTQPTAEQIDSEARFILGLLVKQFTKDRKIDLAGMQTILAQWDHNFAETRQQRKEFSYGGLDRYSQAEIHRALEIVEAMQKQQFQPTQAADFRTFTMPQSGK